LVYGLNTTGNTLFILTEVVFRKLAEWDGGMFGYHVVEAKTWKIKSIVKSEVLVGLDHIGSGKAL
jgi:hypothetical protein